MSDGLVQNLRSYPHASRSLRDEAADRIEALEQDCTALENHIKALEGEINTLKDALRELAIKTHTKAVEDADRIESLEQTIWTMHGEAHEHIKRIEALEKRWDLQVDDAVRMAAERISQLKAALGAIAGLPVGNKARVIASCALEDDSEGEP